MVCTWLLSPVGEHRVQGAPRGRASQHIRPRALWHGADHTPGLQYMETSLHKASEAGWDAVVQTLLEHGADVSAIDEVGSCARAACLSALPTECQHVCFFCVHACTWWRLHHPGGCTALRHVPENVEASLLWHSANDTPALQRERISLHWACIQGHRAVVQTLLAHGANVAAIDEVSAACGCCAAGVGALMCRDCTEAPELYASFLARGTDVNEILNTHMRAKESSKVFERMHAKAHAPSGRPHPP